MRKSFSLLLTSGAVALALTLSAHSAQGPQESQSHSDWVLKSLQKMQTVKVGMTRADLLKVFEEEGGLSTREWRTYAYRGCPYFKVDVKFEPVGNAGGAHRESASDKIVEISRPYLAYPVAD